MKRILLRTLPVAAIALASLLAFGWRQRLGAVQTPPPTAAVAPDGRGARVHAEGQLVAYPDAKVPVAAETAGRVTQVLVRSLEPVKRGQLLATLDDAETLAAWQEAAARVTEAAVDAAFQENELARVAKLHKTRAVPGEALDRARFARDAAAARRGVAEATARRLKAALDKTRITAPFDGTVLWREVDAGEFVVPGRTLFTVADLARVRIEAEVDEFDVARVQPGAPVLIQVEGLDGRVWRGLVEEIPNEVVARRMRPQDPGRASDLRVLLVKIGLSEAVPLKLGQRVEVEIGAGR